MRTNESNDEQNKQAKGGGVMFRVLGAVCAVNFVAHLCFYPALPQTIPIHWGTDGMVNGWGPKWVALMLALLPVILLVLFRFLPGMDPKAENYEKFKPIWNGFLIGVTLFMAAMSWITELAVFGVLPEGGNAVGIFVGGGIGLLFIILGNYMPRVKQNYTFGCKTPWALADEHNWTRTQRMGGIVFVIIGVASVLGALFTGALGNAFFVLFMAVTLGGTAWIYLYSFLVFRGKMK